MSYVLHFWDFPIPQTLADAVRLSGELQAKTRAQNALFLALARRLTARHPCITELDDDDPRAVWSDGPLDGVSGHAVYSIGIQSERLEEVHPFVVETATSLGLVVLDEQQGEAYLPGGSTLVSERCQVGRHLGLPLAGPLNTQLVERTLVDALLPILASEGFEHNRALGGLWRAEDGCSQLLRFELIEATAEQVVFDISVIFHHSGVKAVIEPLLAAATQGQEKYFATATASLAVFARFYRMPSGLAKMGRPLRFVVTSLDELRTLAIELRGLVADYLRPRLADCTELPPLAYYLHASGHDAFRIVGSLVDFSPEGVFSSAAIGRHLFDTERCGGAMTGVLLAGLGQVPAAAMQNIVDAAYRRLDALPGEHFVREKTKLDLCLSLLRENDLYR